MSSAAAAGPPARGPGPGPPASKFKLAVTATAGGHFHHDGGLRVVRHGLGHWYADVAQVYYRDPAAEVRVQGGHSDWHDGHSGWHWHRDNLKAALKFRRLQGTIIREPRYARLLEMSQ